MKSKQFYYGFSASLVIAALVFATPSEAAPRRGAQQARFDWSTPLTVGAVTGVTLLGLRMLAHQMGGVAARPAYNDEIDYENSLIVHQREYGIATCGKESHPSKVASYHINGCHFLILHDSVKSIAIAGHWDDDTKKSEISRVLKFAEENGIEASDLKAYFVGGWRSNHYFRYSEHFGSHLYNSLVEFGVKKENINTEHMYEKAVPNMPMLQFLSSGKSLDPPAYFFMGVSFDACNGELKLSDSQLPPHDLTKIVPLPGSSKECTEYFVDMPGSGCPMIKS